MRVRDHIVLSTGGAAILYPWIGTAALVPWAASILIDVDHYLYYYARSRNPNPVDAMRFFAQAQPPQHMGTRVFHNPLVIAALLVVAVYARPAALLAVGLAFHVSLDVYHALRLSRSRRAALQRDRHTCQWCGAQGAEVVAHLQDQPMILPAYGIKHFISLCPACHELAHQKPGNGSSMLGVARGLRGVLTRTLRI